MERNRIFAGVLFVVAAFGASLPTHAAGPEATFYSGVATVAPADQTVLPLYATEAPAAYPCANGCPGGQCGPACNMCPCVYGQVDGLVMWRNRGFADQPIAIDNRTQQTALSTSDLNADAAGGLRALVGFRCCGVPIEFGYFGLFDQFASASVSDAAPNAFRFPDGLGLASDVFVGANQIDVQYDSTIHSGEINLPCCNCWCDCDNRCCSVDWLFGVRYINLREDLDVLGTRIVLSLPENGQYNIHARNDLYGAQIGARVRRCLGQWSWEATGKAGIFDNEAGQTQFVQDFPNFALRPTISASNNHIAFMGELNLSAIYQLNQTWGLRAGYNLMYLDGLALAPNQLDFSFTPTSGSTVNTAGHLLLHGVNLGLEARW